MKNRQLLHGEILLNIENINIPLLASHPTIWPKGVVYYVIHEAHFGESNSHMGPYKNVVGAHNLSLRHCLSNTYTLFYYLGETEMNTIDKAIQEFKEETCLIFEDGKDHLPAIQIYKRNKTKSIVGRRGFNQEKEDQSLYLTEGSLKNVGNVIHLLMHAIGFFHHQQASNRDEYVKINWDNIESKHLHEFEKMDSKTMPNYGIKYDYDSIMHSPHNAYSKNSKYTIVPTVSHTKITLTK